MNLEHAYFLAVFNELKRLGEWEAPNPLENVRQFRTEESEMAYLTGEQIDRLLEECRHSSAKDLEMIVRICLSTGARWGEAEKLRHSQVAAGKVTFTKTKGKRNRTIPISNALITDLPKKTGALFTPCYYAFRNALERAEIDLPSGQLTHVLRHTFASHFMMNGGNILVLQRILGHTDIKMTMRYAHFAPNHLEEALSLNPLAKINEY
jgi:integrase